MTHTNRRRRAVPVTNPEKLREIAEVIDAVCDARQADPDTERALRITLFALLDRPSQAVWEKVREIEIVPRYVTGLSVPSPLGVTIADAVDMAGLSDVVCPSRNGLLLALRRAVVEHGKHRT